MVTTRSTTPAAKQRAAKKIPVEPTEAAEVANPAKPARAAKKAAKAAKKAAARKPATPAKKAASTGAARSAKSAAKTRKSAPRSAPPLTRGIPMAAAGIDADIEALDLAPIAKAAAVALRRAHPAVKFTSGRRNKADQARAMASNVVKNRHWIVETYASTPLRGRCQQWVDAHPQATTQANIAAGLLSVFDAASVAELGRFSKHLSGAAFDAQPVTAGAEAIKQTIRGLAGLDLFLDKEGGLVRWHAQFKDG